MKTDITKKEAKKRIKEFFSRENFEANETKKIKRLAMKFNIKLRDYRKLFCKKCYRKLRGKMKIDKKYNMVKCENCNFMNRLRIS